MLQVQRSPTVLARSDVSEFTDVEHPPIPDEG
jgi:hypothetical protein